MASKYKGYTGKTLDINLTTRKIGEYEISDTDRELFVGGRFLSTKILWDELKPRIDPLSEENILVVMTAPLTGTGAPSSSRYDISAKSPATGAIGHSNSGGDFGIHLKKAGWDSIIIRGKAKKPSYIEIKDSEVKIKSAEKIWGKDTQAAQKAMGKKGGTMAIGIAGENLVKFASVVSDERSHGRTGMGTVMGSKNLKGIIVNGSNKISIHEPEKFKKTIRSWTKMLKGHPATGDLIPKYGTAVFVTSLSVHNALPTKNFTKGSYEHVDSISGERLADEFLVKNSGCTSCPIRCGRVVKVDGKEVKGPEFEAMALFGSNILNDDLESIIKWNYELDLLGMDSISSANILAFAADLNEKGLWKNGIVFGKNDNISAMLKKMATRSGVGNDLAEGVKYIAEKYGAVDDAPHSKGLEFPAYEPRSSVGHGLGYATSNRGACHLDGGYLIYFELSGPITMDPLHTRSKPGWTILFQNLLAAISAGGNCLFTSWAAVPNAAYKIPGHKILSSILTKVLTHTWPMLDMTLKLPPALMNFHYPTIPHSKVIKQATGLDMSFGKFLRLGERGFQMERLFNLREGLTSKDDNLSKKFTTVPFVKGDEKTVVAIDEMMPKYYRLRGWDKNGVPTKKTIKKLKLDFIDLSQIQ